MTLEEVLDYKQTYYKQLKEVQETTGCAERDAGYF